jgi:hypothetical protein
MVMYNIPSLFNTSNYLQLTSEQKINACAEECLFRKGATCDEQISELCCIYMEENGWRYPVDVDEGITLYRNLRRSLITDLNM